MGMVVVIVILDVITVADTLMTTTMRITTTEMDVVIMDVMISMIEGEMHG
jgi:hypothetical protein